MGVKPKMLVISSFNLQVFGTSQTSFSTIRKPYITDMKSTSPSAMQVAYSSRDSSRSASGPQRRILVEPGRWECWGITHVKTQLQARSLLSYYTLLQRWPGRLFHMINTDGYATSYNRTLYKPHHGSRNKAVNCRD